jgi:hypothetical protein
VVSSEHGGLLLTVPRAVAQKLSTGVSSGKSPFKFINIYVLKPKLPNSLDFYIKEPLQLHLGLFASAPFL